MRLEPRLMRGIVDRGSWIVDRGSWIMRQNQNPVLLITILL